MALTLTDALLWRFYRFKAIHNKTVSLPRSVLFISFKIGHVVVGSSAIHPLSNKAWG